MGKIIQFKGHLRNYRLLYYCGKYKKPIFDTWAKTEDELYDIYLYLDNKYKYGIVLNSTCRVRKEFAPIPCKIDIAEDGYHHQYIMCGSEEE